MDKSKAFRVDWYPREAFMDFSRLSAEEIGVLMQIINLIYSQNKAIENDSKYIGRACNITRSKCARNGVDVKGFVYSRAPEIIESFDQGVVIRAREGRYLAIPTQNAPSRINRRKPTPDLYIEHKGDLRFVRSNRGTAFLVADDRRASYSRKTGEFRGFRKASQRSLKTGRGLTAVVMFIRCVTIEFLLVRHHE